MEACLQEHNAAMQMSGLLRSEWHVERHIVHIETVTTAITIKQAGKGNWSPWLMEKQLDTITFMYHYASIVNADFSMHFLLSKYKICYPDGWKQQKSHISRELSNYLSREGFRGSDVKLLKLAIIKHFPAAVSCQGLLIQSSPKCKVSHFSI